MKRLGIQFFAEGAATTDDGSPAPAPAEKPEDNKPDAGKPAGTSTEKTFTQAEVDKMITERLTRAKTQPAQQTQPTTDTSAFESEIFSLKGEILTAKVEVAMATAGIKTEKIERASRLIDSSKCVGKDGKPDAEKIKTEIEAVLKDFPELKGTTAEGPAGFRIGADGNNHQQGSSTDTISAIFGNKKG